MDIIEFKSNIISEINNMIESYNSMEKKHNINAKLFTEEVERLNDFNKRLSSEIA